MLRNLIIAGIALVAGVAISHADILIKQANGENAVIKTSESGGVHTLTIACAP